MATTQGSKGKSRKNGGGAVDFADRRVDRAGGKGPAPAVELDQFERNLLGDLLAVIEEHEDPANPRIEREPVEVAGDVRAPVAEAHNTDAHQGVSHSA